MSLVIGMSYQDQFVMMSGDSKTANVEYELDEQGRINGEGRLSPTDIKTQKVIKLTDYVLVGSVGSTRLANTVESMLAGRLEPQDDLGKCTQVLKDVIAELKAEATTTDSHEIRALITDEAPHYSVFLAGFYAGGGTGLSGLYSGPDNEVYELNDPPPGQFPAFVRGLGEDLEAPFDLGGQEESLENYAQQITLIHASVAAKSPDYVSSDCHLHALINTGKQAPTYTQEVVDTRAYIEALVRT